MNGGPAHWRSQLHGGSIALPDGGEVPAQVTSFTSVSGGRGHFVMAAPSLWRAAKVDPGPLGLETLMVGVLLHEGTHVAQTSTYGAQFERLSKRWGLPQSFSDDSIQERFASNRDYAASVARETELLLAASRAADRTEARRLATQARDAMRARQRRWFPESEGYLPQAEDIWLTMEGSAQWAAYQWLVDPRGGAISPDLALTAFGKRGKWWSQTHGFALFMALDRLVGSEWKRHAFGDGAKTGLQMLDEAIAPSGDHKRT
jgi:hypothetical protein